MTCGRTCLIHVDELGDLVPCELRSSEGLQGQSTWLRKEKDKPSQTLQKDSGHLVTYSGSRRDIGGGLLYHGLYIIYGPFVNPLLPFFLLTRTGKEGETKGG